LKRGPTTTLFHGSKDDEDESLDHILATIIPRALNKNVLTKGIQSSNPFLVVEMLKLLSVLFHRCKNIINHVFADDRRSLITEKIIETKLPDVQVLLGIRLKFGTCDSNTDNNSCWQQYFITMGICDILTLCALDFPQIFKSLHFDWLKLLPNPVSGFLMLPKCLQYRIMTTISSIHRCYKVRTSLPIITLIIYVTIPALISF
jgi:hypothetical protein